MAGNSNSGGYKQPSNPASVSGPGALSQRTDGGATEGMTQPVQEYTGGAYGDNKATREQQGGAKLAGSPFDALHLGMVNPSDKPMTHGIDIGAGPGSEAIGPRPNATPTLVDTLRQVALLDPSGDTALILAHIDSKGSLL